MSAIFISHSSIDNAWAQRIADWLLGAEKKHHPALRYTSLFLDFDPERGIPIGRSWRDTLYEKLQICRAVIVICSEAYNTSQWCLAELGIAMHSRKLVLPVRIDSSSLPKLLTETQSTELVVIDLASSSLQGWNKLERGLESLSWQERLPWPPLGERNASPFPGLSCFDRAQAPVFFGQDDALQEVQDKLARLSASESRLLLILGASGCGKSSLLRAGVVPWLSDAVDRNSWIVLDPFRPEDDPFGWLAESVRSAYDALALPAPAASARKAAKLQSQLRDLRRHSNKQDAKVVIAIDQFEEVLVRTGTGPGRGAAKMAKEAHAFLMLLSELLSMEYSRVVIIATLRSDFLGSLQLHPSGLHRFGANPILLGPMNQVGFRKVIEEPAKRAGLELEPGLSDQLVQDTTTGDALPLLAFTLSELWRERPPTGGLTLKQYFDFGRLEGAVQKRAEEVLANCAPTQEEMDALKEAFIDHLVCLSATGVVAKQPARLADLPLKSERVLKKLVEARLLVSGKGDGMNTVEIAHESLLRTWPTLKKWLEQANEELLQRRRVERICEEIDPAHQPLAMARKEAIEQIDRMICLGTSVRAARVALEPLLSVLTDCKRDLSERQAATNTIALIGGKRGYQALQDFLLAPEQVPELRGSAAVAFASMHIEEFAQAERRDLLEGLLRGGSHPESAIQMDKAVELPALQGISWAIQLLLRSQFIPLYGSIKGLLVPMLMLTTSNGIRLIDVVDVELWNLPLPGGGQLELVQIPAGTLCIGSPADEAGRDMYPMFRPECVGIDVEKHREVSVPAFAMSRYPITQAQWLAVAEGVMQQSMALKSDPANYKGPLLPVENVSWAAATEWCDRLNSFWREQLGKEAPKVDLPTEAQWEYACRANTTTPFHFGDTLDAKWANYDGNCIYGSGRMGAYLEKTTEAGSYGLVNRWGLADMHGNVMEWCKDYWYPSPDMSPKDGSSLLQPCSSLEYGMEQQRILRGGSWSDDPKQCRSAFRFSTSSAAEFSMVGFRVACFPAH
jgi:formylglycine-generating enzyme required for sulfatase activity